METATVVKKLVSDKYTIWMETATVVKELVSERAWRGGEKKEG